MSENFISYEKEFNKRIPNRRNIRFIESIYRAQSTSTLKSHKTVILSNYIQVHDQCANKISSAKHEAQNGILPRLGRFTRRLRTNVRDVTATHKCILTDICINSRGALNHVQIVAQTHFIIRVCNIFGLRILTQRT